MHPHTETASCFLSSPIGILRLAESSAGILSVEFRGPDGSPSPGSRGRYLPDACRQLEEYFSGERRAFSVPLCPLGTPFQLAVWRALETIPYGETRSYGDIARLLGKPGAARAVGMANHANPLPILIPCHRVIGSDGSLTGYGGGLDRKRFLLELERRV